MKNIIIVTATVIGIIALIVYVIDISSDHSSEPSPLPITMKNELPDDLALQSSDEGAVNITVTPKLSAGGWGFDVVMNTHSVELSEDMVKSSILIVDGKEYKPTSWDGAGPGGHHREGVLRFNPATAGPETLTLKIKAIGGIPERVFQWQLN